MAGQKNGVADMAFLKWGMIGGGEGSQVGPVHRIGAGLDGLFTFAAGALDIDAVESVDEDADALVQAERVDQNDQRSASSINPSEGRRPRRIRLPLMLFLATCISTFWVGATHWFPAHYIQQISLLNSWMPVRRAIINNWDDGNLRFESSVA